jgi:hypothetical protein
MSVFDNFSFTRLGAPPPPKFQSSASMYVSTVPAVFGSNVSSDPLSVPWLPIWRG